MPQERMREGQEERVVQQAETAQVGAEHAPEQKQSAVSPSIATSLLKGKVSGAQRQALVQSVAQNYGNKQVQRMIGSLNRSASAGLEGGPLENDLAERIQSERSNGQPMDAGVRREVEGKLGQDLSPVRVHTGSAAADLNAQMGAKAFTTGRDIFFGAGQSPTDKELVTHEATHTVQQGMSETAPASIGAADTAHEHAAEHNASSASSGLTGGGLQRDLDGVQRVDDPDEIEAMRDPNASVQREGDDDDDAKMA